MGKTKTKAAPTPEPELEEEFTEEELLDELEEEEVHEVEVAEVGTKKQKPTPTHLHSLLALPGVPDDLLDGLDVTKAWLQVQTRHMPAQAMAVGHLAPDALEALASLGYEGHARFEIRPFYNAPDVQFFAAVLPPLADDGEDDDDDYEGRTDPAILALIQSQDQRMSRIESALVKVIEGTSDPFKQIERALEFVERIHESSASIRGNDGDAEIIKTLIEQGVPLLTKDKGKG